MAAEKHRSNAIEEATKYHPGRPSGLNPLALPGPLTLKQKLYGAANFGIAAAMYRSQDNIRLWPLAHNTIAGDMAVTTFIQGILTFCIASGMVHVDLRNNKIDAFPYPWPDTAFAAKKVDGEAETKHGRLWRTFHNEHGLGRGLHFFSGSDVNDIFDFRVRPWKKLGQRYFWSIWKGSVLSALYFLVIWPIAIAITAPIYGGRNMAHTWIPQIIKLIYGFVLGLLMNPLCCLIAMGSEDSVRHHRAEVQRLRFETAGDVAAGTTAAERVRPSVDLMRDAAAEKDSNGEEKGALAPPRPDNVRKTSDDLNRRRSTDQPRSSMDVSALRRSLDGGRPEPSALSPDPSNEPHHRRHSPHLEPRDLGWHSADVNRRVSLEGRRTPDPSSPHAAFSDSEYLGSLAGDGTTSVTPRHGLRRLTEANEAEVSPSLRS